MTIGQLLAEATERLARAGIDSARLDTLILMEDMLDRDRASILAHKDDDLPDKLTAALNVRVMQRLDHTPLAYIRGETAFYGRDFVVTPEVLVPRPETESMIELLAGLPLPPHPHIADVGCGSGCLAVTAALEINGSVVDAYDISPAALAVTQTNAKRHRTIIHTYQTDLLHAPRRTYDVILANLPYVPDHHPLNTAARHEPHGALYGGSDGLDLYRRFWEQLHALPKSPAFVLSEAMPEQHAALSAIALKASFTLKQTKGFAQLFGS